MADVTLESLTAALAKAGHAVDEAALARAFRLLDNPSGCELCGARTKVGTALKNGNIKLMCCGTILKAGK